MPSPPSPLSVLALALRNSLPLKGVAKVVRGKNALGEGRAPRSIVLYPTRGKIGVPEDWTASVGDVWLGVTFRIWGVDDDNAWDLRCRLLQALKDQADAGGVYWMFPDSENEEWDTTVDTAQQGQELELDVLVRLDAPLRTDLTGEIDATALHGLRTELTAALAATDLTAEVTSTAGFASSGAIAIESEQMTYVGLTATSFFGLIRGLNATTPAAHPIAAAVTQ